MYVKMSNHYISHKDHSVQPGSLLFKVRNTSPGWAMYGSPFGNGPRKRIMLQDDQVIYLSDMFKSVREPTKEEIGVFNMLYGVDIEKILATWKEI